MLKDKWGWIKRFGMPISLMLLVISLSGQASNANTISQNSLSEGLVAWYKLDGDATDSSGNGNDGTNTVYDSQTTNTTGNYAKISPLEPSFKFG